MFYLFAKSVTTAVIIGVVIASFIAGWAAEFVMGKTGFGVVTNAVLVMVGIFSSFLALSYFGYRIDDDLLLTLGSAAAGGALALLLPAFLRKL